MEQIGRQMGIACDVDTELLTQVYVAALSGTAEKWLLGQVDHTPEELIAFADRMLQDHIRGAQLRLGPSNE